MEWTKFSFLSLSIKIVALEEIRSVVENQRAAFVFHTREYHVNFQIPTTNEIAGLDSMHLFKAFGKHFHCESTPSLTFSLYPPNTGYLHFCQSNKPKLSVKAFFDL